MSNGKSMKHYGFIQILTSVFLMSACSTGQLRVNSQPESADVYISSVTIPNKKIGTTPLVQAEDLVVNLNEPYQLTVSKTGFEDSHILIPTTTLKRNVNISVKLTELASNKPQTAAEIDKVASQVAEVQNLIKTKNLIPAERKILIMISENPNVATFHELLGNVYYLKKDPQSALASYKKANEIVPGNPDTMRMINKLQAFSTDPKVNQ